MSEPGSPIYRAPPPRKRPAWRTWMWIAVAVVVAILAAVLLTPHPDEHSRGRGGAGGGGPPGMGGGRGGGRGGMPTVVGVATATKGDIPINLGALGTVTPEATVTVLSQIAGTLEKVEFKEGQMVHKGQELALVDPRPYIVALAQAEGSLARDQASLANAQLDLKRYQTLAKQDSVSGQQVDTQAALVKQDVGTVKTDEANVASAKLNLTYCHIIAPVSGRVGLRQVDPGNYITSGSTTGVVVITEIDPIDIVFTLPEDDVPAVQERVMQGATLDVTALDRTGATTLAHGKLLTLDNVIDTSTGTVKAKAQFSNANGALFPSQFVNVELLVNTLHNAVIVPTQAVRHGSKGDYVFIVSSSEDDLTGQSRSTAKMVMVKSGPSDGDRISIASGLSGGEQVITDGGDRLTDGASIILPGHLPSMPHKKKPAGFFDWIAGLFGHKPNETASAGGAGGGAASGGGASDAGGAPAGGGGGGGHGGGHMQAMLAQLNLTADQQAKIKAAREQAQASGDFSGMRDKIAAILTPEQKAKMAQLRAAQQSGDSSAPPTSDAGSGPAAANLGVPPSPVAPPPSAPDSSATPTTPPSGGGQGGQGGPGGSGGGHGGGMRAMFAQLDLTPDQQAKIKAAMDDARASGDFSGVREKIAAILTPAQKAKMAQLRAAREAAGGGGGGGGGDQ